MTRRAAPKVKKGQKRKAVPAEKEEPLIVVGASASGKSSYTEEMLRRMTGGRTAIIDPHGDLVKALQAEKGKKTKKAKKKSKKPKP